MVPVQDEGSEKINEKDGRYCEPNERLFMLRVEPPAQAGFHVFDRPGNFFFHAHPFASLARQKFKCEILLVRP
jgi:hypothetical protein